MHVKWCFYKEVYYLSQFAKIQRINSMFHTYSQGFGNYEK